MANYLDTDGLTYFWSKATAYIGNYLGCGPISNTIPPKTLEARIKDIEDELKD